MPDTRHAETCPIGRMGIPLDQLNVEQAGVSGQGGGTAAFSAAGAGAMGSNPSIPECPLCHATNGGMHGGGCPNAGMPVEDWGGWPAPQPIRPEDLTEQPPEPPKVIQGEAETVEGDTWRETPLPAGRATLLSTPMMVWLCARCVSGACSCEPDLHDGMMGTPAVTTLDGTQLCGPCIRELAPWTDDTTGGYPVGQPPAVQPKCPYCRGARTPCTCTRDCGARAGHGNEKNCPRYEFG
jgi:hypothetical protein